MARKFASVTNEGETALTATTVRTVLQLVAATNQSIAIVGWAIFFDSTSNSAEPVQVRVLRQTGAGTSSAATPVIRNLNTTTLQATARKGFSSTEPTAGNVLDTIEVHPQSGYQVRYGRDDEILIGSAGRVGIECTAPANVNCRAQFFFEE